MTTAAQARRYLRAQRYGVLSTLSQKLGGYPFGSLAPYVLDHAARPVILISRLAEHTRNIDADPRVSLLVHEPAGDLQAAARVTLIGEAAPLDAPTAFRSRYVRFFPEAARLLALGDFSFYAITPRTIRFIGGFGDIRWISAEQYAPPASQLAAQEEAILAHMNQDHVHALRDYCRFYHQRNAERAVMIGIDCDGFEVRADGAILRFDFDDAVIDAPLAREALVAMAKKARVA